MYQVHIGRDERYAGIAITIVSQREGDYSVAQLFDLKFLPLELGAMASPCLVLRSDDGDEFLRGLAQGLMEAGYFPDVVQDKQNELMATKYHLEDMRTLVFKRGE